VIVVDPSAIVAILREEPEADQFELIIGNAQRCFLSAVGFVEASMVMIGRAGPQLADGLQDLLTELSIELVPFDAQQARISQGAFIRFGKGRHPAGLNFGACVWYALAQSLGLPLLYKGGDFAKTDIASAL
jgi:ribonuclease VapC